MYPLLSLCLCPALPGAFQGALHGVLKLNQLDEAVRDTMRRGGCTASRSSFIGACFGAQVLEKSSQAHEQYLFTDTVLKQIQCVCNEEY